MGFNVSVIADILKFPWPLYPKYKNVYPIGLRYEIPNQSGNFEFTINLPSGVDLELQSISFAATAYKDGDYFSLLRNNDFILKNIYTKETAQSKELRPIVYIDSSTDTLKFVYNNITGTSKVIYLDLDFVSSDPINN